MYIQKPLQKIKSSLCTCYNFAPVFNENALVFSWTQVCNLFMYNIKLSTIKGQASTEIYKSLSFNFQFWVTVTGRSIDC